MPIKKEHAQGRGTRAEERQGDGEGRGKAGRKEGRKKEGEWKRWNVKKGEFGDKYVKIFFAFTFCLFVSQLKIVFESASHFA